VNTSLSCILEKPFGVINLEGFKEKGPVFALDCHYHLLGSVWRLFVLFKTGEYPEDPLPRQIGPSYHSLFSLPPLPAKTFKRAILEALEKETSASHKEAGFSSNLGIDYPHLYKHWRKCNLIRGFLWKFLSFQLPIGWKKEPCPFCGAKRKSIRHLFGTCSALALQLPPF